MRNLLASFRRRRPPPSRRRSDDDDWPMPIELHSLGCRISDLPDEPMNLSPAPPRRRRAEPAPRPAARAEPRSGRGEPPEPAAPWSDPEDLRADLHVIRGEPPVVREPLPHVLRPEPQAVREPLPQVLRPEPQAVREPPARPQVLRPEPQAAAAEIAGDPPGPGTAARRLSGGCRPQQELLGPQGRQQCQRARAPRRGGRPAGSQRRRQDHRVLYDHRADQGRPRAHRARRPGRHPPAHVSAGPAGGRAICRRKPRFSAASMWRRISARCWR